MKCRVEKSEIDGEIECPANKSYTHRAIFLASLAIDKSIIKNILRSGDTNATINACKNFGVEIKDVGRRYNSHQRKCTKTTKQYNRCC